jgi:hypothetical protein
VCNSASSAGDIEGPDFSRRESSGDRKTGKIRRPLSAVKDTMRIHMAHKVHCACQVLAAKERERHRTQDDAAMLCGRLVLQNLKEHDSDASYERRIAGSRASGANVGTKNHSQALVPKLRASMCKVLTTGFQKLLTSPDVATGRPPAFAPMADKATVQRETGQMHGIILMVNGVLTALFLSVAVAPDATGFGLAELLKAMLMDGLPLTLSLQILRCSLTAGAFDGQYQSEYEGHAAGLQVLAKFCELVSLNKKWVISRWDGAHRIELGMNEARDETRWYAELAGIVSATQTKYLYGKGFDRVKKACSQLAGYLKPAAIGVVCTTRFCHSERKVYKNFFRNSVIFIKDMRQQISDQVNGHVEIAKNLATVASLLFLVQLAGLLDLLQHVKNLSLALQTVNQLPWELAEVIDSSLELLESLGDDLAKEDISRTLDPTARSNGKRTVIPYRCLNNEPVNLCSLHSL